MKKFKYRLEALLKLREQIEKDRQKELAAATAKVNHQSERVSAIDESRRAALDSKRTAQSGVLTVDSLQLYSRYLFRLKRDTLGARELLKGLRKTESQKRGALLEAARDKKIYEKLKDRQQQQYLKDVQALETKEADETGLNSYRAARRQDCGKS